MGKIMEGKVALVTGASSGIGRAAALAFAREGAKVVVVADHNLEGGNETMRRMGENGGDGLLIKTDVSRAAEVRACIENTVGRFGRLDCAFNNAGIEGAMAATADMSEESWDHVLNVNLKGVWLCMKYEIQAMLKTGRGAIVNCSSILGLTGFAQAGAYAASKHGILGLTKTAALEYAKAGIRVNAVCPAFIRTPMIERAFKGNTELEAMVTALHPMGRMGEPGEIAEAVVWLCSDQASFVTGYPLAVDGGYLAQ